MLSKLAVNTQSSKRKRIEPIVVVQFNKPKPNEPTMVTRSGQQEPYDPILDAPDTFIMGRVLYSHIRDLTKAAQENLWVAEEIDMAADRPYWIKCSQPEQRLIKFVTAFFAGADGQINANISSNFLKEIKSSDVREFYILQSYTEIIHARTYSDMIIELVPEESEQDELFGAIENTPSIKRKADWASKWMNESLPFRDRLFAFSIVEGIFFCSSFCAIYWLRTRDTMPNMCRANDFIARDESLHVDFAVALGKMLVVRVDEKRAREMMIEGVQVSKEFVHDAIPERLDNLSAENMCKYVEFMADNLMESYGFKRIYNTENPFVWMTAISVRGKTNFFERKETSYKAYMANVKRDFSMNQFV